MAVPFDSDDPSAAGVHGALTHLVEATRSLDDAICHFKLDELTTARPVYVAIILWFRAKDAASHQIRRAAYLVDDLDDLIAEGRRPSVILLGELHELRHGCDLLHRPCLWPFDFRRVVKFRMKNDIYTRMDNENGYLEGLVDEVLALRGQWDKLTGLLDRPGHGDVRSGGSAEGSRASRMTCDEANATVAALRDKTGLANQAINKYAKRAGVATPGVGKRNFRYSTVDVRKILQEIISSTSEDKLRSKCREELGNLQEIAE